MSKVTLEKASSPGWTKDFNSLEEAKEELSKYICDGCLEEVYNGTLKEVCCPDIYTLLATPCGCEFWLEEEL